MVASKEAISVGRWTGDFIMPACVISQPRFFPGLHYLHRMMVTDVFVVLDTVQFTPRHEENRAKLKGPTGPQWLTVPVRQSRRDQPIGEIRPDDTQSWRRKLIGTLNSLYAPAPCFEAHARSEEHTSELQSQSNLVCRLLLEKKKHTHRHLL